MALLPLTAPAADGLLEAGVESLEPVLRAELAKTGRFEVIPVSPEELKRWTGQPKWRADEPLPRTFFNRLRQGTGADAVFFCQLTRYQAYQPLAVGWKLSLVEERPGEPGAPADAEPVTKVIWSADEILNAGRPDVARAARWYYTQQARTEGPARDPGVILNSPEQFGEFTLNTLLATIPPR